MKFDSDDGIEMWLMDWKAESAKNPPQVVFSLTPEGIELFRNDPVKQGKTPGQRYVAILMRIDDDEKPNRCKPKAADQPKKEGVVSPELKKALDTIAALPVTPKEPKPRGPQTEAQRAANTGLCGLARKWCEDDHFQEWIAFTYPEDWGSVPKYKEREPTPLDCAAAVVKTLCKIESRILLNSDNAAILRFNALIREPYIKVRTKDGLPNE